MAKSHEVLEMLIPNGGWIMNGREYENIEFLECEPITKEQFEAGFATFDSWKAEQDSLREATKKTAQDKLVALGLTTDDLKSLGL